MNAKPNRTAEENNSASDPTIDSPTEELAYPRRNLHRLYCPAITYRCATGTHPRPPREDSSHAAASAGQGNTTPCVPCAYKIGNFDIALDTDFTRRVPNQRPEQCPRSHRANASVGKAEDDDHDRKGGNSHDLDCTMGYRRGMNVLTVGDGDFSFSLAVARLVVRSKNNKGTHPPGMVVATSYEDSQTLRKVYPDFDNTLKTLNSHGKDKIVIGYNVDATRLDDTLPKQQLIQSKKQSKSKMRFHRICWNFPCSAIDSGQDGQNDAMEENKELVRKFVANALPYLDEECGEIHLAHKTKPPYNQWGLEKVAMEGFERSKGTVNNCKREFEFKGRVVFDKCTYRGYTPRKALDRKSFPCHDACIYVFGWKRHETNVDDSSLSELKQCICHSTIKENELGMASDKLPKPSSVIPITESVIEKVRSIHLHHAQRRANEKQNKRNNFQAGKRNGSRNKRRKKH
mmetsp:Transcript_7995/g.17352  ORF Transcript_7995/g.17352 Transcript_7995/m.17352 type:complete len:459 (+) Transcript_7995:114-1490(+)